MSKTNESAPEQLMAGTKSCGLGHAAFHALAWTKGIGYFSRCGVAHVSAQTPASTVPTELRCRSKACQAAFREAGV